MSQLEEYHPGKKKSSGTPSDILAGGRATDIKQMLPEARGMQAYEDGPVAAGLDAAFARIQAERDGRAEPPPLFPNQE